MGKWFRHNNVRGEKWKQGRLRRGLGILLAAAMIFQALPFREAAISSASGSGLCEHHAEHTADCGYAEAEPEQKCTHEHTEECYRTVGEEDGSPAKEPDCRHEHDESCGYREETPAGPCTFVCEICNGGILEDDEQENDSETGTPGTENEEEIKEPESGQEESVCPIEELIAALPDAADVIEDNADDVRVQLEEILALFTELTENEQEQLDLARCYELQEALDAGSVSVPLAVETENNPRLDVSRGRIWIGGDSLGSYYIQSQTDYRPVKDEGRKYYTGTVTITGTATSGSYRSIKVDGEKGSSYQIVLDNVALYASEGGDGTSYAGMEFADAAYDITLTLRGNNTLQGSMVSKTGAIQRPGLYMYDGSLTIQGSGTLNLTGGTNPNGPSLQGGDGLCINSAKLTIKDGAAVHARGGNPDRNPGDGMWGDKLASVVLENGILDLQGHYGIGGGGASNPIVVKGDRTEIISLSGQGIADHLSVKLEAGNGWYGVVQSGKDSSSPGEKQYIAPDSSYTTEDARWHRITMDNAKYSLAVQGGSGSSGAGQYFPTEKVSVSAGTKEGCGFKEWKLVSGSGSFADAGKADTTFDMGWEDAVISPEFCPLYTLTVEGGSAGKSSGIAGEETSLSLGDVPEGKAFSRWELSGSGTLSNPESPGCTFTFGDGDASVKAVYVDGQAAGNFVVGTEDADGFSYEGGVLKITGSGVYIVGMKIPGSSTGDRIEITGNNSTVVLNGVNINGGNNPAVRLETNKSAIIKLGGENRLSSSGSSGIYAMGESFGNTSTNLTITSLAGDGSTDGRLEVSGKTGIGCSSSNPTANIIINGGTIIASGNNSTLVYGGVGIGGAGKIGTGKNGTITINGGDITARGEGSSTYNPPCGFCTGGGEVKLTGEPSILIEGSYAHSMDTSARNVRIVYDGIGSSVRSVTVTPGKGQVTAGGTLQFQARVEGGGNADKSVVWSVDGNAAGTSIDADGLLTVAADETAAALTVTAVNSYSGLGATADVTVDKMTLVVTKWPHAAEATYGQPLNQIPLVGGTAVLRDENQADWPVKGSFSWDDGGRILDAGTHVCGVTFTAADGSLSASGTVQVTVKPAQLKIQWPTAGQNVVYTGRAAVVTPPTATLAGVEVAIDSFRYSCAENGSDDYISGLPTNAGTYAVKAGMEAQGNYTAAETAVPLVLTIEKAAGTLTVPGTPVSRKFGDAEFSLGCSTDGDGKISYVSDNVDVASVSPDGNVLITGAGKAVITVSLAEGVNYTGGASQKVEMIVEKAAAPSSMEETRNYAHTGGSGGAVIIDIGEKLPENRGETTYTFTKTDGNNILSGVSVDGDGNLKFTVEGNKTEGDTASITVTAKMANYDDTVYTVNIELMVKKTVELQAGSSISIKGGSVLTYGQRLLDLPLDSAVFVEQGTDTEVKGTLAWKNPEAVPAAGTKTAEWIFRPEDDTKYEKLSGTVAITVTKATPYITGRVSAGKITCGDPLSKSVLTGTAQYSGSDTSPVAGSFAWKDGSVKPAVSDSGVTKYIAVFTPADGNNYNSAETEITLTIEKAKNPPDMPSPVMNVEKNCGKVGDVELPEGWQWQEADQDKALAPGVSLPATAVYTGADKDNYENVTAEVTITRSDCGHEKTELGNVVPATCRQEGYSGDTYCMICGELLEKGRGTPASGHDWQESIIRQPTTSEEGLRRYICRNCKASREETVPKLPSEGRTHSHGVTESRAEGPVPVQTPETGETEKPGTESGPENSMVQEPRPYAGIPFIKGADGRTGWNVIRAEEEKAEEGSTIDVDMNGSAVVPGDIFDSIKGRDITINFDMGNGILWSVNGKSITADKAGDIDFSVKTGANTVPVDIINNVTGESYSIQISLAFDGEFGFTAVLSTGLGKENAGYTASLYYYNESTEALEFICADKVAEDGTVSFAFTHASDYVIVIDAEQEEGNNAAEPAQAEETGSAAGNGGAESSGAPESPEAERAGTPWWILAVVLLAAAAGAGVIAAARKKGKGEDENGKR